MSWSLIAFYIVNKRNFLVSKCFKTVVTLKELRSITRAFKAWFPYDRPDRPSRLKIGPSDRDDHMETQQRRLRRPRR